MSDLVPRTADVLAKAGGVIAEGVRYGVVIVQLTAAGAKLRGLSEQVRSTYRYVENCAQSVDRLADQAAALNVDPDTVSEHRDAATLMRSVLEEAEAMAEETEELSTLFQETADAHQADYGPVAETASSMDVPMAEREFYSNR
ncbi:hypothetical protein O1Q96_37530 [Streptomyces sp. Qhu-G9]|uniref:hypothetical protein n=1 Tax=Streptomyces sp. Qhu-G9 TaxID=3452799 RepID=UPI0022AC7A1E|nr:hypothetical protein [Streptomyces aurantiacus]WAU84896.1 hypothetical protein O1Q96_37530 [Streptomyces aurantiacus]